MTRLVVLLASLSVIGLAIGQDDTNPTGPKPDGKAIEPKKDATKADPTPAEGEELDVHKTAERIAENAQKAGDRLKEKDPGEGTRKIQQDIIKDIDALLKKAQEPPPQPMSGDMNPMPPMMPPPMGGQQPKNPMGGMGGGQQSKSPMGSTGGSSQPKAGNSGGGGTGSEPKQGRRPRRDRQRGGDRPMGAGEPMANAGPGGMNPMPATPQPKDGQAGGENEKPTGDGGGNRFGRVSPKRKDEKLADLYKDVWGQLPDRLRQEMDLYYREKFMPRYSELLRQYYAALAEQKKAGTEGR
ncbi:MAG: hypothetical protein J2P46_01235 [Zavarzinella sp.]|nr:hypothetical protein [Zavarzinella sp.]